MLLLLFFLSVGTTDRRLGCTRLVLGAAMRMTAVRLWLPRVGQAAWLAFRNDVKNEDMSSSMKNNLIILILFLPRYLYPVFTIGASATVSKVGSRYQ